MAYRWCEQCGEGLTQEQFCRANYCGMCGAAICKDTRTMPVRDGPMEKLESVMPVSAARHLQAVGEVVSNHPVLSSVGAVGIGAAGIAVAPLVMVAGQGLMVLGGIVAGVSAVLNAREYDNPYEVGVKFGLGAVGVGAVVYGSGYVLLAGGGLSVAGGIGVGAYTGVKAIAGMRKPKLVMNEPLLLEGGYNAG